MYQTTEGRMEVQIQHVTFSKILKDGEVIIHHARIIPYTDTQKHKLISLLTNDMEPYPNEIITIYQTIGDETIVQTNKAEPPIKILIWKKC